MKHNINLMFNIHKEETKILQSQIDLEIYIIKKIIRFYSANENLIKFFDLINISDNFDKDVETFIFNIFKKLNIKIKYFNGDITVKISSSSNDLKEFESIVPLNFNITREYKDFFISTCATEDGDERFFGLDSLKDLDLDKTSLMIETELIEEEIFDLTLINSSTIEAEIHQINLDYSNDDIIDIANVVFLSYEDYLAFNDNLNEVRALFKKTN